MFSLTPAPRGPQCRGPREFMVARKPQDVPLPVARLCCDISGGMLQAGNFNS